METSKELFLVGVFLVVMAKMLNSLKRKFELCPSVKTFAYNFWVLARTLLLLAQGLHLFSLPIFPPPLLSTSFLYTSLSLRQQTFLHADHYSKDGFDCETVHMHDVCRFLNDLGPWFDFLDRKYVYFKRANHHVWEGTVITNHTFICLTLQKAVENENLANPKADITQLSRNLLKFFKMSV